MNYRKLFIASMAFYNCYANGQVAFIIDSLPNKTPASDTIYVASELNGWNPKDKNFAFSRQDGVYTLVMPKTDKPFEYKLSRGDWRKVEVDAMGRDVKNRVYSPDSDTVRLTIAGWRDFFETTQKASTASENVRFLPTNMEMKKLNRRRTIRLYLPPNYFKRQAFPVIYMHDGQNVFDESTAFAGEWRVDEIMDSLYYHRGFAAIVVAIYNDSKERLNEYSPWRNDSLGYGGGGDLYADFIVNDLKPYIDKHFRTNPDPKQNVIMGSSMGGLISLYIGLKYPDKFGGVGVFSPSLWFSPKVFEFLTKYKRKREQRYFLLAGEQEGKQMVEDLKVLENMLYGAGYDEDMIRMKIAPDGKHAEWFWSQEFPKAIEFLLKQEDGK